MTQLKFRSLESFGGGGDLRCGLLGRILGRLVGDRVGRARARLSPRLKPAFASWAVPNPPRVRLPTPGQRGCPREYRPDHLNGGQALYYGGGGSRTRVHEWSIKSFYVRRSLRSFALGGQ